MWSKICTFVLMLLVVLSCKEAPKAVEAAEEKARSTQKERNPASLYEDLQGNPVALSDYQGKKVLLNYWATWCRPCIEEMPGLLKAQDALSTENYVFLFASDQSVATIEKFRKAKGFDFTFIKYNGSWAELDISALPVTDIYNETGEQVERMVGGMEWDTPEMIQKLKAVR